MNRSVENMNIMFLREFYGNISKLRVKQYSIAFSIDQARKFQDECKKIESELHQIDKQLAITPCEVLSTERQIIKA